MLNWVRLRELVSGAAERGGAALGPQRERGLWSFLTWSFFLSQLAIGSAFTAGAAQGAGTAELNTPDGSANAGASSAPLLARPDVRPVDISEPPAETPQSASVQAHGDGVFAGTTPSGTEQPGFTSDAGMNLDSAMMSSSVAFSSAAPVAASDDSTSTVDVLLPGAEAGIHLPQIGEVLPPVLETIDNLVDDLGSTLDDLFVPVVGTIEDLADALGPTLDQALSPLETLADNIVGGLGEALDPVMAPVVGLTEGIGDLLEPVGSIGGQLIALADPVIDIVEPVLAPVMNIVEAAEPVLDPILDVTEPVIGLVGPVVEPLLEPLAPVVQPVLDILPPSLGNDGLLGNLFGVDDQADAVGSSGTLSFAANGEAGRYELIEAGAYTELGITMHETPLDSIGNAADLIGNVAEPISDLLDDHADGHSLPGLLGHLQQEIALRGLGEGLI